MRPAVVSATGLPTRSAASTSAPLHFACDGRTLLPAIVNASRFVGSPAE